MFGKSKKRTNSTKLATRSNSTGKATATALSSHRRALGGSPGLSNAVISDIKQLATLQVCSDAKAVQLMSLGDTSKPRPIVVSSDYRVYRVSDPTSAEAALIRAAASWARSQHNVNNAASFQEYQVRRNTLDSWIANYVKQSKASKSGLHVQRCVAVMNRAIELKATDIHVDRYADEATIIYRVNGILITDERISADAGDGLMNAFWEHYAKDGVRGDIAKDGRFNSQFDGRDWLFRLSYGAAPKLQTRSTAIRLRNMDDIPALEVLGYNDRQLGLLREAQGNSGMILICGSVNSGKSTLQAALMALRPKDQFNLEISDQVEVNIPQFVQIQKPTEGGELFEREQTEKLFKLPTRHDIDFIALNEIRDVETAQLMQDLMQLGTPGISSIHAKGWTEAVNRLLSPKMCVDSETLFGSDFFNGIAFQTLGRILCDCKLPRHPEPYWDHYFRSRLGDPMHFRNPQGCSNCSGSGIKGLTAVAEYIPIVEENRMFLRDTSNPTPMREWMRANNVPTIHQHALEKIKKGIIDPQMVRPKIGDFSAHNIFDAYQGSSMNLVKTNHDA